MDYEKIFLGCVVIGLALAFLWIVILILAQIWGMVWNIIDDNDNPVKRNLVVSWVMSKRGYAHSGELWAYTSEGGRSDGEFAVFVPALALFFFPFVVANSILFYPVALAVLTMFCMVYVARFVRRQKKLFDKHVKDPGAHK